jgi:hypothetical protein
VEAANEKTSPTTKGRRGSAGRPKLSQLMKEAREGEALLKVREGIEDYRHEKLVCVCE